MRRLACAAAAAGILLLSVAAAQAGTVYVDGISALTVSLTGENTKSLIALLTGIQHLLWMIFGALVIIALYLAAMLWRWK